MKKYFILMFLSIFFMACFENADKKNADNNIYKEPEKLEAKDIFDLSYGPFDTRNKMDISLPADRNYDTPVMIFIHGGYWRSNNKNQLSGYREQYREKGYATASINYRFTSSTVNYKQIMEDIDNAVNYIISKAGEWKISNNKIALLGYSSGAVNSILYSYGFDNNNVVDAVVCFSGAYDFTDPDFWNGPSLNKNYILDFTGGESTDDTDNIFASPANYLKNIPTLIFHSDNDTILDINHTENFIVVLENNNITFNYQKLSKGHSHFYGNITVESLVDTWMETYLK